MKVPGMARVLGAVLFLLLCCGCVHNRYMALMGPLEKVGVVRPDMSHARLVAIDLESGRPLAGFHVTILSEHSPIDVKSDSNGNLDMPVSDDLRRENPAILVSRENVGIAPAGYAWSAYRTFVRPFEKDGAIASDMRRLRIQVATPDEKTPIEGFKLIVMSKAEPTLVTSDSHGMIQVPVSATLRRENPLVMTDYKGPVSFYYCGPGTWSVTGTSLGATIRGLLQSKPVEISTKGMWQTITGDFTVWYCPEYAPQAKKAEALLSRQYEMIRKTTGLKPINWGVIILPEMHDDIPYVVSCAESGCSAWCYSAKEVDDGRFAEINAHEWTESTIDDQLRIYHYDRSNRFIGDGLAEYVSCLCVKAEGGRFGRADEVADYLAWLRDSGVHQVNLLKEFRSMWVLLPTNSNIAEAVRKEGRLDGYGLSLAFWDRLAREHGTDVVKRFLYRLRTSDKRDSAAAIMLLQDMTGEKDIRARLSGASIDEAIGALDAMAPAAKKGADLKGHDEGVAG
jgi:hypothetical protein